MIALSGGRISGLWASAPSRGKSREAGAGRTPTVSRRDLQKGADVVEFESDVYA
jgi:hypothetical protein